MRSPGRGRDRQSGRSPRTRHIALSRSFPPPFGAFSLSQTPVTAVTESRLDSDDTPSVAMVRRAGTNVLLEPGDTRQRWKGEAAAASLVQGSPVAARYRPPAPATGPPILSCVSTQAPPKRRVPSGAIFSLIQPTPPFPSQTLVISFALCRRTGRPEKIPLRSTRILPMNKWAATSPRLQGGKDRRGVTGKQISKGSIRAQRFHSCLLPRVCIVRRSELRAGRERNPRIQQLFHPKEPRQGESTRAAHLHGSRL
jgi:hypothetical protein